MPSHSQERGPDRGPPFLSVGGHPHHVLAGTRALSETPPAGGPPPGTGPVIVFVGGLAAAWFIWDPVIELLPSSATTVQFDRPGLGLGPRSADMTEFSLAGESRRINSVLDALSATGTIPGDSGIVLVAHSLGAFYAEAFARRYPDRMRGLVLVDPSTPSSRRPRGCPLTEHRVAHTVLRAISPMRLVAAIRDASNRCLCSTELPRSDRARWFEERFSRSTVGAFLEAVLREDGWFTTNRYAIALARRRAGDPALGIPVHTVAAAPRFFHPRAQRSVRAVTAATAELGGTTEIARPSRHHVMVDRPQQVADAILRMLPDSSAESESVPGPASDRSNTSRVTAEGDDDGSSA